MTERTRHLIRRNSKGVETVHTYLIPVFTTLNDLLDYYGEAELLKLMNQHVERNARTNNLERLKYLERHPDTTEAVMVTARPSLRQD